MLFQKLIVEEKMLHKWKDNDSPGIGIPEDCQFVNKNKPKLVFLCV